MTGSQPGRDKTGMIGRTLRLMLGLLLGWMAYTVMRTESPAFSLSTVAVFAGLTALYAILHFVFHSHGANLNRWLGASLAVAPIVLLFAFGGSLARVGAVDYVAISLLFQAIRADPGSTVMFIPGTLLGRRTVLPSLLFSPIDWVERRLLGPGGLPG